MRSGSAPERVLGIVGTNEADVSGLCDDAVETVGPGQDLHGFGSVTGEVEDLVPAAADQDCGDLEQACAESFRLPRPAPSLVKARVFIQAMSSEASWTIWHQMGFCAEPWSGNFAAAPPGGDAPFAQSRASSRASQSGPSAR